MNTPILSICIPTYNRASYLETTLLSIVNQRYFVDNDRVEVVVSDNCSSDNTQEIGEKYANLYEDKIRYYRNSENIKDLNFEKVLSYGKGVFLKLNNDTLIHLDGSLEKMVETIEKGLIHDGSIYFTNGSLKGFQTLISRNLDEFINRVSFCTTWIGSFGLLRGEFDQLDNFSQRSESQLTQVDVLLRLISKNGTVYIDNRELFHSVDLTPKGGYNIFQVFVRNYFQILYEYQNKNELSWWTLFVEKYKVMKYFVIPWSLKIIFEKENYTFSVDGAWQILRKEFGLHPYSYIALMRFSRKYLIKKISKR